MNLKKFVSSISVLAIAASAFAGFAVTASAAESETASLVQKKSWYADNRAGTTEVSTEKIHAGVGPSSNSSNYPGMAAVQFSFENEQSLEIKNAVLTFDVTVSGSNRTLSVYSAANSNYDFSDVPLFTTEDTTGIYTQTDFGTKWTYSNILGDLTQVFNVDSLSGITAESIDVTDYISGNKATFVFSNANAGADIANASLTITYLDDDAVPAGGLTIKHIDGSGKEIADSIPVGVQGKFVGDTYDYVYPAYIVSDGTLYKSNSDVYKATATFTAEAQTVEIAYTAQDANIFQYVEYDGSTDIANAEKASNGAMTNNFGTASLTVEADGVYTVIFATGRTTAEGNSARSGTWKVNDGETTQVLLSGPNPGPQTFENVELSAGDVISITQNNSKCALDYILIVKTADIEEPPVTTRSEGFSFESSIDDAKTRTLVVTATNGTEVKTGSTALADKITLNGDGDVSLTVLITNIPEDVTISSVTLQ